MSSADSRDAPRHPAIGLLLAGLAGLASAGCQRPEAGPPPMSCLHDSACPGGYHCGAAGLCVGDIPCVGPEDCCPGERCEQGRCRPRQMCSPAAPCGAPGAECVRGLCLPRACTSDADCPAHRRCLLGLCRRKLPCGGHCSGGRACAARLNTCVEVGAGATASCKPGELALLRDELTQLGEGCRERPRAVSCAPLPALPPGRYGMPAALVRLGSGLAVFAYERTRGDLVLARHSAAPPHPRIDLTYLAGVPADAPIVGDPAGPRGGVAAPGQDAGRILAAAEAPGGGAHVVFSAGGGLCYLHVDAASTVAHAHQVLRGRVVAVDAADDDQGRPVIAALTEPTAGPSAAGPRILHVLSAKVVEPGAADRWQGGPWRSTRLAASPPHPYGEVLPRGLGAQLSVAARGARVALAAYEYEAGELHLLRGQAGSTPSEVVATGALLPGGSADLGRFPALALSADGRARIVCQDADRGRLVLLREEKVGGPLSATVLDDGVRADGLHRVGADAALALTGDGRAVVAYQDSRSARLVVLRVLASGKAGSRTALPSGRAAGFCAGLVALGTKAFAVGSARLQISSDGDAEIDYRLWPVALGPP